ncbi:MAG: hypothetical protein B7C24_12710 [Bacteroidetes bacterium 4572_77]|nr:MAG: hypothetical protein B7C24_12710 [Bacteroidetes bacterium 4572_77]
MFLAVATLSEYVFLLTKSLLPIIDTIIVKVTRLNGLILVGKIGSGATITGSGGVSNTWILLDVGGR